MNNTKLSLVNRNKISGIENINNLNVIDEEMAATIAREIGATAVIQGSITKVGNNYRFRILLINTADGTTQGMQSFLINGKDDIVIDLLDVAEKPAPTTQTPVQTVSPEPQIQPTNFVERAYTINNRKFIYKNLIAKSNEFGSIDTTFVIDVIDMTPKPAPVNTQPAYSSADIPETNTKNIQQSTENRSMRGVGLLSFRYESSFGLSVGNNGGTVEFGGIVKNGFYLTGTGSLGNNGGGGGLNLGGMIGGEKVIKTALGFTAGFWKQYVYRYNKTYEYNYNNSVKNGEIFDMGFGGGFLKLLFGNNRVNFDITNRLLFGIRQEMTQIYRDYGYYWRYDYDYEKRGTVIWQISAGFTFTGNAGN